MAEARIRRAALWGVLLALCLLPRAAAQEDPQRSAREAAEEAAQELERAGEALRREEGEGYGEHIAKSGTIAGSLAMLTGESVNPLLGVTIRSVWVWWRTPGAERAELAWWYQPGVWGPLLVIMLAMLFNSTIAEALPPAKVPLNALSDLVNKSGALVSLPLVLALFADEMAAPLAEGMETAWNGLLPAAHAAEGPAGAGRQALLGLGYAASLLLGGVVYLAVWLTFNTVDVLILVCPFPAVDATLKSARLGVMGLLIGATLLSPVAGLVLAVPVLVISLLVAGWSQRLSVFGFVYATDILLLRRRWGGAPGAAVRAFSNRALKDRLPMRTCGRLRRAADGRLVFSYRPWLVLPRRETILDGAATDYAVGQGLLNPYVVRFDGEERFAVHLRLPPRHQGREAALAEVLGLQGVRDTSALRGFRALWRILTGRAPVLAEASPA
jgi:hypothetical protein